MKGRIASSSPVGFRFDHQGTSLRLIIIILSRHFLQPSSFLVSSFRLTMCTVLHRQQRQQQQDSEGPLEVDHKVSPCSMRFGQPRQPARLRNSNKSCSRSWIQQHSCRLSNRKCTGRRRFRSHKTEGSANACWDQLRLRIDSTTNAFRSSQCQWDASRLYTTR